MNWCICYNCSYVYIYSCSDIVKKQSSTLFSPVKRLTFKWEVTHETLCILEMLSPPLIVFFSHMKTQILYLILINVTQYCTRSDVIWSIYHSYSYIWYREQCTKLAITLTHTQSSVVKMANRKEVFMFDSIVYFLSY